MAGSSNLYSEMVGWAKILLPLAALGLLSTLFLFAKGTTEPSERALAEATEIAREQRVSAPEFAGLTDEGSTVVISAKSARPDAQAPDTVSITDILMRLDNPDGSSLEVTATEGQLDGRARVARFLGLARLVTSTGYALETNGLIAELDSGTVTSDGLLEIRAPFGAMTAGKVVFQLESEEAGMQMLFTDGVRLLYTPQEP